MATTELKTRTFTSIRNTRHLELAGQYVSDTWIPPNPEVLGLIQKNLRDGTYGSDCKLLVKDLAKDISLFTFCLKNLKSLLKGNNNFANPIEALENANLEDFKKLLLVQDTIISNHRFSETTKEQALCLQQVQISATTAEALAEKAEVDPNLASSCAILRQLGMTLVAWNYPHVYMRAMTTLQQHGDLDQALSKVLGFSPQMLAIKLAAEWGMGPEIRVGMGDHSVLITNEDTKVENTISQLEFKSIGEKLSRLCEIGEAMARASAPDTYPSADRDWELAKKEIEYYLGADGLKAVQARIREACSIFQKANPALFKPVFEEEVATPRNNTEYVHSLIAKNPYLNRLTANVAAKIKGAYRSCEPGKISRECMNIITNEVAVEAGFIRGCIYLVDPVATKLVPRVKIGDSKLEQFRAVNYSSPASEQDPIVMAFHCKTPIKEESVSLDGKKVSFVAGALGDNQKAGVVFLEISEKLLKDANSDAVGVFKAIKLALQASLSLT